jgi:hypothetical protein
MLCLKESKEECSSAADDRERDSRQCVRYGEFALVATEPVG